MGNPLLKNFDICVEYKSARARTEGCNICGICRCWVEAENVVGLRQVWEDRISEAIADVRVEENRGVALRQGQTAAVTGVGLGQGRKGTAAVTGVGLRQGRVGRWVGGGW